jgi:cytochrome c
MSMHDLTRARGADLLRAPLCAILLGLSLPSPVADEARFEHAAPYPLPGLGEPLAPDAIALLPETIFPDGRGLPPGSGTAARGAALYTRLCIQCHGPEGRGGSAPELAGGRSPLDSAYPDQNIGNWWPYATTLFDFIRRAMPMAAPGSLSDEDCYALTAWLLERNGLWPATRPLDAAGLAALRMPNREGFDSLWPDRGPAPP